MREYQRVVTQQQTKEIWAVALSLVVLTLCAGVTLGIYTWSRSGDELTITLSSSFTTERRVGV